MVIRCDEGYLLGWWTPLSWQSPSSSCFGADASTFVFTLTNPAGVPAKYKVKYAEYALYFSASFGPTIGVSDLGCNGKAGWTYFPQDYEDMTGRGRETFTGNYEFQVSEIEVFLPL